MTAAERAAEVLAMHGVPLSWRSTTVTSWGRWAGGGWTAVNPTEAVAVLMADSDLCLALAGWEAVHGDPKMDGSEVVWFDKCPDRPGKAVVELPPGYMLVRRREAS